MKSVNVQGHFLAIKRTQQTFRDILYYKNEHSRNSCKFFNNKMNSAEFQGHLWVQKWNQLTFSEKFLTQKWTQQMFRKFFQYQNELIWCSVKKNELSRCVANFLALKWTQQKILVHLVRILRRKMNSGNFYSTKHRTNLEL